MKLRFAALDDNWLLMGSWLDKLTMSGREDPLTLSLSKGALLERERPFSEQP